MPTAEPLQTEALHTTSHLRTQAAFCLYSVSQPCPPSWYVRDSLHTFPYLFHTRGSGLFTLPKECPSSVLLTHTLHILAPYSTLFCFPTWTFKFPLTKDFRCPRSHFFFISVPAACYAEQAGPLFPLQPNQSFSAQKSVLDIADNQTQHPEVACHRQIMQRQVFPYSFTLLL